MTILRLQNHHVSRMAELERLCFSMPWSRIMIMSELSSPIGYYIAAEEQGVLLGYAGMQIVVGEGYITNIAVDPAFRGKGIGAALLSALIAHGLERSLDFLTLEVRPSNIPAQNLYKKLGFAEAGIRKGYYEKPKEDAILMTRYYGGVE